jgi:hypothetical protein
MSSRRSPTRSPGLMRSCSRSTARRGRSRRTSVAATGSAFRNPATLAGFLSRASSSWQSLPSRDLFDTGRFVLLVDHEDRRAAPDPASVGAAALHRIELLLGRKRTRSRSAITHELWRLELRVVKYQGASHRAGGQRNALRSGSYRPRRQASCSARSSKVTPAGRRGSMFRRLRSRPS